MKKIPYFLALASALPASAALVQISTLIPDDTLSANAVYDPGFGTLHSNDTYITRTIAGAPVSLTSDISGTSGASGGASPDSSRDITLNTFSTTLRINYLGRFGDTTRAGGVRWTIDLSPIDSYLSTNSLGLTALQINLDMAFSDQNSESDIYLSYTNAAEGIAIADIDLNSTDLATNWTTPGNSVSVGSIANGTHKVLALNANDTSNPHPDSIDLLPLYEAGVRDLNLVFATPGFWGGGDNLVINLESGVYLETTVIPEPSTLALVGLSTLAILRRRRLK
ncbi:MAG: PEP-CTERM sorting domain-containing protein [Verrucomicrobiota bacterium]